MKIILQLSSLLPPGHGRKEPSLQLFLSLTRPKEAPFLNGVKPFFCRAEEENAFLGAKEGRTAAEKKSYFLHRQRPKREGKRKRAAKKEKKARLSINFSPSSGHTKTRFFPSLFLWEGRSLDLVDATTGGKKMGEGRICGGECLCVRVGGGKMWWQDHCAFDFFILLLKDI